MDTTILLIQMYILLTVLVLIFNIHLFTYRQESFCCVVLKKNVSIWLQLDKTIRIHSQIVQEMSNGVGVNSDLGYLSQSQCLPHYNICWLYNYHKRMLNSTYWVFKKRRKACSIVIWYKQVKGNQTKPQTGEQCVSITAFIQGKVILRIAEFFWTTGDKHIIIPKEIVETGHL